MVARASKETMWSWRCWKQMVVLGANTVGSVLQGAWSQQSPKACAYHSEQINASIRPIKCGHLARQVLCPMEAFYLWFLCPQSVFSLPTLTNSLFELNEDVRAEIVTKPSSLSFTFGQVGLFSEGTFHFAAYMRTTLAWVNLFESFGESPPIRQT